MDFEQPYSLSQFEVSVVSAVLMAILGREPVFRIARTNRTSDQRTIHHPGQVDHRPIKQLRLQVENFLDLKRLIQKALT